MTSDLKPRVRSKKRANYRLYALLGCVTIAIYFLFLRSGDSLPAAVVKMESAASSITKGLSGTHKDLSKLPNEASTVDKETLQMVHEIKKQAAADDAATDSDANDVTEHIKKTAAAAADARNSYLTTDHGQEASAKEVTVPASGKGRTSKSQAYDAADALEVLFESYEMIVFSKTYCPHSKRAKSILDGYDIRPRPLIYELDVEAHGDELQAQLGIKTGRRTVPNVVVHGTSIGGGDELAALDMADKLVAKVRALSDLVDITRKALRNE